MLGIRFALWFLPRRSRSSWLLTLACTVGVLFAITLASLSTLYLRNLSEAGFDHALSNFSDSGSFNLEILVPTRPIGARDYARLDEFVSDTAQRYLPGVEAMTSRMGSSQVLPYVNAPDSSPPAVNTAFVSFFFQEGFTDHAKLVSGQWPSDSTVTRDGIPSIEAAIGAEALLGLDWDLGRTVYVTPFQSSPGEKIAVTVVGQVEPADEDDPFWSGNLSKFKLAEQGASVTVHLFTGTGTSFSGMAERYPTLLGSFRWSLFLDPSAVTYRNASHLHSSLATIETDLNKRFPRSLVVSSLGYRISDYQRTLALSRLPFLILISLILGIVLYFLAIASVVLAKERNREVVSLRSRGASLNQSSFYLPFVEAAVIVLPGVLLGPVLGWILAGLLPTGTERVAVFSYPFSLSTLLVSVVAGTVVALIYLTASFAVSVRTPLIPLRESQLLNRPGRLRYAVDLLVLVVAGVVWWQLRSRSSFSSEEITGAGLSFDLTLLLAPAFLILAAGLLISRLVPFLFLALSRLFGDMVPFWLIDSFRRVYRDYSGYVPLFLLTFFIAALAIFSANYAATLAQSHADQARYSLGGEIVVRLPIAHSGNAQATSQSLEADPSIRAASPVYRGSAFGGSGSSGVNYSLLSLDSSRLPLVSWFRGDFAEKDLSELAFALRVSAPPFQGVSLPGTPDRIGVWVSSERAHPNYTLRALLRDSTGRYETLRLGNLGNTDWDVKVAELSQVPGMQPPLTLVGIYVAGGQLVGYGSGFIQLDDVFVSTGGETQTVEDFESARLWTVFPNAGLTKDEVSYTSQARSGSQSLRYTWTEPITTETRGVFASPVPMPIPAIGGPGLSVDQELVVRIEGKPVGFRIVESADYFPTLFPTGGRFLITDIGHLSGYFELLPLTGPIRPGELWIGPVDNRAIERVVHEVLPTAVVVDQEAEVSANTSNPWASSLWNGLSIIIVAAVAVVLTAGLVIYAVTAVKGMRAELGLLQNMGLSRRQLALSVALERLVVPLLGLVSGVWIGAWTSRWSLRFLEITPGGQRLVPPLELVVDRPFVAVVLAAALIAVALATFIAVITTNRLSLRDVLRVEE